MAAAARQTVSGGGGGGDDDGGSGSMEKRAFPAASNVSFTSHILRFNTLKWSKKKCRYWQADWNNVALGRRRKPKVEKGLVMGSLA